MILFHKIVSHLTDHSTHKGFPYLLFRLVCLNNKYFDCNYLRLKCKTNLIYIFKEMSKIYVTYIQQQRLAVFKIGYKA